MSSIHDKIRKLLAMSRDSGASENEQSEALRLAQALMTKHGIENVEEKKQVDWGQTIKELDKRHHAILAVAVGKLFGCTPVFSDDDSFRYAGRESNRAACEVTVNYVCDQVDMLYKTALPKGMSQSERAQWRRDFKLACSMRVARRVDEMIQELSTKDAVAQASVGCTALVVLDHKKELEAEVDDFLSGKTEKSRSRAISMKPNAASIKGFAAGDKVNLQTSLGDAPRKAIGAK